jgi:hypothetical protein
VIIPERRFHPQGIKSTEIRYASKFRTVMSVYHDPLRLHRTSVLASIFAASVSPYADESIVGYEHTLTGRARTFAAHSNDTPVDTVNL